MSEAAYAGGELDLFAQARRWKAYWSSKLRPHLRGAVLEVGAGLGANTPFLRRESVQPWVCLEPDPRLAARLEAHLAASGPGPAPVVRVGTIEVLDKDERFGTLLYIDVLEHIEDDRAELRRAAEHLTEGGRLIVLAPAHRWLFSAFDRAIGHHRRYTARQLAALTPPGLRVTRSFYLDSVGLLASAANRLLLRQSLPKARQLAFWDRFMVPCSRILDPLCGYRLGKTVVCIWEKTKGDPSAAPEN